MSHQITSVQEINKRYYIEIDGQYHLFLYYRDIKSIRLSGVVEIHHVLTEEELHLLEEIVLQRGRRYIFNLLAQKDYSVNQLREKLFKGKYIDEHIDRILQPFIDKSYVNDERLIARKVEGLKKTKSKMEIEYQLLQKGFQKEEIRRITNSTIQEDDEIDSAYQLLEKKYRMKQIKNGQFPEKDKMLAFLSRKGYSIENCLKAYRKLIENEKSEDDFS